MNAPASSMQVTLMTGSGGMLGRNAGEARNSDLMRKPESAASERQRQCNPRHFSAMFTIEQLIPGRRQRDQASISTLAIAFTAPSSSGSVKSTLLQSADRM